MNHSSPTRRTTRRIVGVLVAGLLAALAVVTVVPVHSTTTSSSPAITSPIGFFRTQLRGGAGTSDGVVRGRVTVFDDSTPAVSRLDPALLAALRRAATRARDDRIGFDVNSGWRSAAYQEQLLREAVSRYGSKAEAARWVATADTSPHVSGDAVDLGGADTTAWLARYGAAYGLCQVYGNEPWHFELRPDAVDHGCPPSYADPTHDPRMQQ
jgi:D-alanyl-D-alanine carboxypeptidase